MSQPWKFLPLALVVAVGLIAILPGNGLAPSPDTAHADIDEDCEEGDGHRLRIDIIDDDTGDRILLAGAEVETDPDAQDGQNTRTYTDNGSNDDNDDIGRIQQDNACEVDNDEPEADYVITLVSLPEPYDECDFEDEIVLDEFTSNETVEFVLENCPEIETPTPEATDTPEIGDPATVIASASPNEVNCNGTSIVTVQVRDENGEPVEVGTTVQIAASFGSVSPSSGQTTGNNGSAFTFFTAPADQGGEAVITATADGASGQTTIDVDCAGATPTTAAPPTVAPGVISPPSTGDAGLASSSDSWQPFSGLALIAGSIVAAAALVRARA